MTIRRRIVLMIIAFTTILILFPGCKAGATDSSETGSVTEQIETTTTETGIAIPTISIDGNK